MRRIFKWIGIVLGGIVGLVLVAATVVILLGQRKLNATYTAPDSIARGFGDSASLARGEHIMLIHSCQFCHGDRLEGAVFLDIPPGLAVASNLTPGKGGVGATYAAADWDRAVRYGIRPNGKMVLPFMPYDLFNSLNDEDAGHLAAYLESLQPVDNELPASKVRLMGKIMFGLGDFLPEKRTAPIPVLEPASTPEYGSYIASTTCIQCHGDRMQGGKNPDPEAPPAPPLRPTSAWSDEQFAIAMRTGRTPARQLTEHMPWKYYAHMTDTELGALRAYIRALPASTGTP